MRRRILSIVVSLAAAPAAFGQDATADRSNHQQYMSSWIACRDNGDVAACDRALSYTSNPVNRTLLNEWRIILSTNANLRSAIAAKGAQIIQQAAQERRASDLRDLATDLDRCGRFIAASCDTVLASAAATVDNKATASKSRQIINRLAVHREQCQHGDVDACDSALASPAADAADKGIFTRWRDEATPYNRALTVLSNTSASALATLQSIPTVIRELPLSTQITGAAASLLAVALAMVMVRQRPATVPPLAATAGTPPLPAPRKRRWTLWRSLRRATRRRIIGFIARRRMNRAAVAAAATAAPPPLPPMLLPAVVTEDRPRDTQTAVDAMELAHAYQSEFQHNIGSAVTDPAFAARTLNTLSLISRQLEIAERADHSATLTVDDKDGSPVTFSITMMKGNALLYEGMCRMTDDPKRAIKIFEQCLQLVPDAANAYFWIGMIHAGMLNKARAIEAFEKALALDPRDLDYRKELVRAQAISGAQVAYDRAVTGTRTTINFARWMWTGFIVIALISFVSAIIRGDPGPAIAIFFSFMIFGLFLRLIAAAKAFFSNNLKL